jgi:hypothetical protein
MKLNEKIKCYFCIHSAIDKGKLLCCRDTWCTYKCLRNEGRVYRCSDRNANNRCRHFCLSLYKIVVNLISISALLIVLGIMHDLMIGDM